MIKKIKIKVSEQAYEELINILNDCPEFTHIRFKHTDGCCKSTKVDVMLDILRTDDIEDKIDNLPIIYNSQVLDNINEIIVVYRNSSFMLKTIPHSSQIKDCSTCKVGCKSNGTSHCSGCSSRQK